MNDDALDPLIHVPTRLKIVATLAALPGGDTLSFTRLQDLIGLTPGNLIIHLRKLEDADYISSEKTKNSGTAPKTTVTLTSRHGPRTAGWPRTRLSILFMLRPKTFRMTVRRSSLEGCAELARQRFLMTTQVS